MSFLAVVCSRYCCWIASMNLHYWNRMWFFFSLFMLTLFFLIFCVFEWRVWLRQRMEPCERVAPVRYAGSDLPPYPIDLISELDVPHGYLDEAGVPFNVAIVSCPATYQPTTISQYGLVQWNAYLRTGENRYKQAFMAQADWLATQAVCLANDMSGWLFPFPWPDFYASRPWLSCLAQGNAISVLVRAYQLTGNENYLTVARRAVRTFEIDIVDGGVRSSVGESSIFFEEVAVNPSAHILNGFIFGLLGLYDYVAVTKDEHISALIQRSHATMHVLIDKFDRGYWSGYDLLKRHLATYYYHDLHVVQLKALALHYGCEHCGAMAMRWERYQRSRSCRLQFFIASRIARYRRGVQRLFSSMKPYLGQFRRKGLKYDANENSI